MTHSPRSVLVRLLSGLFFSLAACDSDDENHDEIAREQSELTQLDEEEINALLLETEAAIEERGSSRDVEQGLVSPEQPEQPEAVCLDLEYSICFGICYTNFQDKLPQCLALCHDLYC